MPNRFVGLVEKVGIQIMLVGLMVNQSPPKRLKRSVTMTIYVVQEI